MLKNIKDNIGSAGFVTSFKWDSYLAQRLGVNLQINAGMMKHDAGVFWFCLEEKAQSTWMTKLMMSQQAALFRFSSLCFFVYYTP